MLDTKDIWTFLVYFCLITLTEQAVDYVIVEPPCGPIRGILEYSSYDQILNIFLGIAFAVPPVGDLRFRAPVPLPDHEDVVDATEAGASCHQPMEVQRLHWGDWIYQYVQDLEYDEDCLNLNIYVPGDINNTSHMPVMVFFYGGANLFGSANFPVYEGDYIALSGDVIVVVVNYRLGPYGFLSTANDALPGNYGYLDQLEALRWVQRNIASFGGDTGNVVVFGESAGNSAITLHMMSPLFDGYFHKAIGQSGCHGGVCVTLSPEYHALAALTFGHYLGCPLNSSDILARCFREASVDDINAVQEEHQFAFAPVVDGYFLLDEPRKLIETGNFAKMPYMMGVNSEEGSLGMMAFIDKDPYEEGLSPEEVTYAVSLVTNLTGYTNKEAVYDAILNEFFEDLGDPFTNLRGTLDMVAGVMFVAPMQHMLRYQVEWAGEAFNYYHTARPTFRIDYPHIELGSQHADELYYMWGSLAEGGFMELNGTEPERALCHSMVTAWTSFAHTGKPTFVDTDGSNHSWPMYDMTNKTYLEFGLNMTYDNIKYDLLPRTDEFWNFILPSIGESWNTL